MSGHTVSITFLLLTFAVLPAFAELIKLDDYETDLVIPPIEDADPAPGKRVRHRWEGKETSGVYHLVYLPTDWEAGNSYPVIFEYPGNRYRTSPGTIEGCELGYGISGGKGVIWISLPFVDLATDLHAPQWWGDVAATVEYAKHSAHMVAENFGGNPEQFFLAGFSRGAIACNYIGLHDDEIAALWRGFICHSHYDGVKKWGYPASDRASAKTRLARLGERPQFISHERTTDATRTYLAAAYPKGNFTFVPLPFGEHTARWTLRDISPRKELRNWFSQALKPEKTVAPR